MRLFGKVDLNELILLYHAFFVSFGNTAQYTKPEEYGKIESWISK